MKFCSPYVIEKKLSEADYVLVTPDRRRKTHVCRVNMLKRYVTHSDSAAPPSVTPVAVATVTAAAVSPSLYSPESDDLCVNAFPCSQLQNSGILGNLPVHLQHLDASGKLTSFTFLKIIPLCFPTCGPAPLSCRMTLMLTIIRPSNGMFTVSISRSTPFLKKKWHICWRTVAVPNSSEWSSPCLLVPKSDQTSRFCTDFRNVNSVTKADSYPLPQMEDCMDRVGSTTFLTKLDLLKGYWEVPLTP